MTEKIKRDGRSNAQKIQQGRKLTKDRIELMQTLRMHGASFGGISAVTGHSKSTVQKYCSGVEILPKHQQLTVQELLGKNIKPDYSFNDTSKSNKKKELRDHFTEKELRDINYWIDNHVEGRRFEGPLDLIDLAKLQEIMDIPTDYHSKLNICDWADHYLAGKGDGKILQHFPHQWSQSQYDMFNFWEKYRRAMFETFRAAGKTMVGSGILLHEIPENRDDNYFIMSETDKKATQRIRQVGNVLLTNKPMMADYGFLPHFSTKRGKRESWSGTQITIKRTFAQTDPTLMSFSTQSAGATGAHFAGGIYDDVWSFQLEQKSVENKEKWHGWRDNELEGCLEDAWELFLLTRKGPYDLYQDLEDSGMYAVFKRPAIITYPSDWKAIYADVNGIKVFDHVEIYSNDGEISDTGNGRFSMEYFLTKMLKTKKSAFESEYQLNPLELVGKYFKAEKLIPMYGWREFMNRLHQNGTPHKIVAAMDLAFSNEPTADFNALTVWVFCAGHYYFLETYLKRAASDEERATLVRQAKNDFPTLLQVYIEADLQQTERVKELKIRCPFVSILPIYSREEQQKLNKSDSIKRSNLTGKAARIHSQLEDPIEAGLVHINVLMRNYKEFQEELKMFPQCKHFDVLDSCGMSMSKLKTSSAALLFAIGGGSPTFSSPSSYSPKKQFFVRSSRGRGWF